MDQLSAQTRISDAAIRSAIERLRVEHGECEIETGVADRWELRMYYGSLSATLEGDVMLVRVAAIDETCLSYMKMTVAGRVAQHLAPPADCAGKAMAPTPAHRCSSARSR